MAPKNHTNKKDKSSSSTTTSTPLTPKPDWPPLRPILPASDLYLEPILDDQIYLIRNFFTANLCKSYVSFLSSLPLVTTPGKPKRGEAVRVNDRFQIEDRAFAQTLWKSTALRELVTSHHQTNPGDVDVNMNVDEDQSKEDGSSSREDARQTNRQRQRQRQIWGGEPLGLNPNIRIYRYSPGQFFAQHYDESNLLSFTDPRSTTSPIPARTTWTLLIYLTTCSGGETVFYPDPTTTTTTIGRGSWSRNTNPNPISIAPETGLALLHRHGEQCLLHEGKEVQAGEKWVLRSDLVVART